MEDENLNPEKCTVINKSELEMNLKVGWEIEEIVSDECIKMIRKSTKSTTVKVKKELL